MNKLLYYAHRLKQLGIKQSYNRFAHRAIKTTQYYQLKYNIFKQASPTTFAHLSARFKLKNITDVQQKLSNYFVTNLFNNKDFLATIPSALKDHKNLIEQANKIVQGQIELFGIPMQFFDWHSDYKQPNKPWPQNFYRDIKITAPKSNSINDYHPDIKVPWELSRMHQMVILGLAYHAIKNTDQEQAIEYATAFEQQTTDWINNNKYLYGVNWVCPMDVAIRATNLIWAYFLFQDAPTISNSFLEQLLCTFN